MNIFIKSFFILTLTACVLGCDNDNNPEPEISNNTLIKVGEVHITGAGAKAAVFAEKALVTGYNELFISLTDSVDGSQLQDGHLKILPMMDMGMMKHSAPVENPTGSSPVNGYYKVPVVFIMAGTASQWSLDISFHNHKNHKEGNGILGVEVINSNPSGIKSSVLANDSNTSIFLSLVQPKKPSVGINDFEVVLHRRASMMDFPFTDKYTLEIVPEMPSMGHGSPNNVNPVHDAMGHYKGKVNFTMTGLWKVTVKLYRNGILVSDDLYFELTVQ